MKHIKLGWDIPIFGKRDGSEVQGGKSAKLLKPDGMVDKGV